MTEQFIVEGGSESERKFMAYLLAGSKSLTVKELTARFTKFRELERNEENKRKAWASLKKREDDLRIHDEAVAYLRRGKEVTK